MPAYAIVDIHIDDIEQYLEYQRAIRPLVDAAGAHYLVRGGSFEVLEGDYQPQRLIIVEFPSMEDLQAFYQSDGYLELEPQRRACSSATIVCVEGLGADQPRK